MTTAAPIRPDVRRQQARRDMRAILKELERRRTPDDLHAKQKIAFESTANELLYGGAAGGGKSFLFRRAAIKWCDWIPGLQVYIFRREFADLYKNHMEGTGSFPELLGDMVRAGKAKILYHKNQIRFRNGPYGTYEGGSVIHLCHCQHEKDVLGYQGAEIHVLLIDELTQWTGKMYRYLRGRVRIGGLKVPKWLAGLFPRIMCGANPGGIGHNFVKAMFIDNAPELEIKQMPKKEGGMRRQFIRALLEDNPTLTVNDPEYEDRLEGLGDPALVRAMRSGDWDIVSGGMFDDLWRRDVHAIAPFEVPTSWRIDRAFDWGSSKPFSVGWWAETDGTGVTAVTLSDGTVRRLPPRSLIRINEWYGWDGVNPDVGIKMQDVDIAKGILQREKAMKLEGRVKPGPADSSIFNAEPGRESIGAAMAKKGVQFTEADKKPGSRKVGWEACRRLLTESTKETPEGPCLFVFNICTQFIRTFPVLPRDQSKSDDVDTKAEDHIGDETRYRVTAPRREVTSFKFRV